MKNNWFELWYQDKQCMLETMIRNMTADLEAGYNYFGSCIQRQKAEIEAYKAEFDAQMDEFRIMEESRIQHWCYYDLRKRGAIS